MGQQGSEASCKDVVIDACPFVFVANRVITPCTADSWHMNATSIPCTFMEVAKSPSGSKGSCGLSHFLHAPDQLDICDICHYLKNKSCLIFLFRHGRILPVISNESRYAIATFAIALKSHRRTRPHVLFNAYIPLCV